jgi:glycosyltransferase involved in cell wall biosynthesis
MVSNEMKEYPKFSIALVNYKTVDLTKICLTLLKKHIDAGLLDTDKVDIWVVDNDSNDESTDYLRSLDWINLIERKSIGKEVGFAAHGQGLDLILGQVNTDYLFLMHTDTFIHDPSIFKLWLTYCQHNPKTAAVGCVHQLNRGYIRTTWRTLSRFFKFYTRQIKLALGMKAREPKPYIETYIKSFFALWNVKHMKQSGLTFFMENRIPGYALQDIFKQGDLKIKKISPMKLFKFLDHVEAGTVGIVTGYTEQNRRVKRKNKLLKRLEGRG